MPPKLDACRGCCFATCRPSKQHLRQVGITNASIAQVSRFSSTMLSHCTALLRCEGTQAMHSSSYWPNLDIAAHEAAPFQVNPLGSYHNLSCKMKTYNIHAAWCKADESSACSAMHHEDLQCLSIHFARALAVLPNPHRAMQHGQRTSACLTHCGSKQLHVSALVRAGSPLQQTLWVPGLLPPAPALRYRGGGLQR